MRGPMSDSPVRTSGANAAEATETSAITDRTHSAWRLSAGVAVIVAILAVLAWVVYSPSIGLPLALVDDPTHIDNSERFWQNLREGGVMTALREDTSIRHRLFNPVFYWLTAVLYRLSDYEPYHGFKLASVLFVALCVAFIPLLGDARNRRLGIPSFLGALIAGATLLLGEGPWSANFQSLMANWYRLHTTDSYVALFSAPHCVAVCVMLTCSRMGAGALAGWALAALATLVLAISMKPTALVLLGPLVVLAGLLAWSRRRREALALAGVAGAGLLICGGALLFYRSLAPAAAAYTSAYNVSPAALMAGVRHYATFSMDMLGPLWALVPGVLLVAVALDWRTTGGGAREVMVRHAVLIYLLLCFAAFIAAYVPWPHRIARYYLPAFVPLCAALGVAWVSILGALPQRGRLLVAASASVGAVLAVAVPAPLQVVLYPVLAVMALRPRLHGVVAGLLLGVAVSGAGWVMWAGGESAANIRHYYVERELRQDRLVQHLIAAAKAGERIGQASDGQDEHIASPNWLVQRATGQTDPIKAVRTPADLQAVDEILLCEFLPANLPWLDALNLPVVASFDPEPRSISVPIGYREWQGRLRRRDTLSAIDVIALPSRYHTVAARRP